jgi:hypothetical protein
MLTPGTSMFPNDCPQAVSYHFRLKPDWLIYLLQIAHSRPFERAQLERMLVADFGARGSGDRDA